MYLCSDDHEEICYESRDCPLCEMRDDLKGGIEELEKRVTSLTDEVDSLSID